MGQQKLCRYGGVTGEVDAGLMSPNLPWQSLAKKQAQQPWVLPGQSKGITLQLEASQPQCNARTQTNLILN